VRACEVQTLGYKVILNHVIWPRECEDMPILKQRYHWNSFAAFDICGTDTDDIRISPCILNLSLVAGNVINKEGSDVTNK